MGTKEIALQPLPHRGKQKNLEDQLRQAIRRGRLAPGERLPSSRALAADLHTSRRLIVNVYEQLVAEGYLVTRGRGGTLVAPGAGLTPAVPDSAPTKELSRPFLDDWRPGLPDLSCFPTASWNRRLREATASRHPLDYTDPEGVPVLRDVLAQYLRRLRSVAPSSRVRVCAGLSGAITLWGSCMDALGIRRVALEDPGPVGLVERIRVLGLEPIPLPVDEHGARTDQLKDLNVGAVVLTPAHQFPTGAVLSPDRRAVLIDWARREGGWVFEDDYDAEFRYGARPIGSLQGMAPDRVTTSSSVSKTLAPGLRLGWMVLPPELQTIAQQRTQDLGQPGILQYALAGLMERGDYDRHIRHVSRLYSRRREALVGMLTEFPHLTVGGVKAGLHAWIRMGGECPISLPQLVSTAQDHRIRVYPVSEYLWSPAKGNPRPAFALGFAGIGERRWVGTLERLTRCLRAAFAVAEQPD